MRTPGKHAMIWMGLPTAALLAGGTALALVPGGGSHPGRAGLDSAVSAGRSRAAATPVPVPSRSATPVPSPTRTRTPVPVPVPSRSATPTPVSR